MSVGEWNEIFLIKCGNLSLGKVFENLGKKPKKIISARGGLESLHF